jgi:hypothetical protein
MSKLIVPVAKIEELLPIAGADKIVLAKVLGFYCIVSKDTYSVGDLIIYIPIDSILPDTLINQFNLNFVRRNRVSCLKLRGVFSEGLILNNFLNGKLGDNVADKLGITKWEPPEPHFQKEKQIETVAMYWKKYFAKEVSLKRAIAKTFTVTYEQYLKPRKKLNPYFDKYTDIQNIKHYPDLFTDKDNVVIMEKCHGSNLRCGYLKRRDSGLIDSIIKLFFGKYEFVYGSHNVQKSIFSGKGYYGEDVYGQVVAKYNMGNVCKSYPNFIFYGELIGPKIQKGFTYDLNELDMRIFDIKDVTNPINSRYLNWTQVKKICDEINVPRVPELYEGNFSKEKVTELTSGNSTIASHIREGVCIKSNPEVYDYRVGRKILKSISQDYLLLKDRTDYH